MFIFASFATLSFNNFVSCFAYFNIKHASTLVFCFKYRVLTQEILKCPDFLDPTDFAFSSLMFLIPLVWIFNLWLDFPVWLYLSRRGFNILLILSCVGPNFLFFSPFLDSKACYWSMPFHSHSIVLRVWPGICTLQTLFNTTNNTIHLKKYLLKILFIIS